MVLIGEDIEDDCPVLAKFRFSESFWSFSASKVFIVVLMAAKSRMSTYNAAPNAYVRTWT
jgi:hypothetical protein